jgi:hypothetical protein
MLLVVGWLLWFFRNHCCSSPATLRDSVCFAVYPARFILLYGLWVSAHCLCKDVLLCVVAAILLITPLLGESSPCGVISTVAPPVLVFFQTGWFISSYLSDDGWIGCASLLCIRDISFVDSLSNPRCFPLVARHNMIYYWTTHISTIGCATCGGVLEAGN